ncbi:MAG: peptidylprolyl isomerase [Flavobacteriaceae bacterium]|nr:peptidylprolyl isomerase [Flavobacteriaceae bacterium]
MAILNSIRKRGIFLILIIAMALFAFILGDIINKGGSGQDIQDTVGSINGTDLSREEFMGQVEAYSRSLGPNATMSQAMNVVWDREVRSVLLQQQIDELGITVSEDQLNEVLSISLANNPTFQDENGFYSEARVVEYVASIQGNPQAKADWDTFIQNTRESILQNNYLNMIRGGLTPTNAEGEQQYRFENDKIDIQYVHIPYTKIADEDVSVSEAEIEKYVRDNPNDFTVDPIADIQYVTYDEEPSIEDVESARLSILELVEPFSTTEGYAAFVNDNSEEPYNDEWLYEANTPESIKDTIASMKIGDVYGPYKVDNTFNLTRLVAKRQLPDSVKARHILIPQGLNKTDSITRTKEMAKATADSLLTVLKANRSKFVSLVEQFSSDVASIPNGGTYDYYPYRQMVPEFRDFTFEGKVGDMGVVESQFGYHLIEIEGQKNKQDVYKVATITQEIEPSEKTLGEVFAEAAKFEEAARAGDFEAVATEKGLEPKPVNRIGKLDATIPGIGSNRTIVNWAFEEDSKVGDVKRFSVNDSYVIAQITRKSDKESLMSVVEASTTVTPILRKKKKAELIRAAITGTTLEEVASSQNVTVKTASALTRATPTIADAGTEPAVVGAAFGKAAGETTGLIDGDSGVFMVRVTAVNKAPDLENYAAFANQTPGSASQVNNNIYQALKKAAEIEDNRASFY